MGKRPQALGSQAGIGRPARIGGSTIGGVVVEGDGGPVAGRSVVGEHLTVHRNRSGGHGSGGLGDHRRRTDRGSGGEGEGIRPTRSRGIGSLESGMVGGAGSQVIEEKVTEPEAWVPARETLESQDASVKLASELP